MLKPVLWALQGAAEYGALTGSGSVRGPHGRGPSELIAWATEHQVALLGAAACLLLLWMVGASRRR